MKGGGDYPYHAMYRSFSASIYQCDAVARNQEQGRERERGEDEMARQRQRMEGDEESVQKSAV